MMVSAMMWRFILFGRIRRHNFCQFFPLRESRIWRLSSTLRALFLTRACSLPSWRDLESRAMWILVALQSRWSRPRYIPRNRKVPSGGRYFPQTREGRPSYLKCHCFSPRDASFFFFAKNTRQQAPLWHLCTCVLLVTINSNVHQRLCVAILF